MKVWDTKTKNKFCMRSGIKSNKKCNKPDLELLVKSKAKQIWSKKICSDEDNKSKSMIDDNLLSESESDNDSELVSNIIKVKEYWFEGKIYYLDIDNNELYKNITGKYSESDKIGFLKNGVLHYYK